MSESGPAQIAPRSLGLTLGAGACGAGCCTLAAALVASVLEVSAAAVGLVAALAGGVVGLAAGPVPIETVRWVLDSKRRTAVSWLPLTGALGGVVVLAFRSGIDAAFWTGLAAVFLLLVGWVLVVQTGQDDESAAALAETEVVLALPDRRLFAGRYTRGLDLLSGAVFVIVGGVGVLRGNYVLVLLAIPALFVLIPGIRMHPCVVEGGIVFENYLGTDVALGTTFAQWDELPGYRLEDETLVIEREFGRPLRFDRGEIEEFERVEALLAANL